MSFNGPAPTDTPFDTIEITRQYDFMADFPLYPLNLVADLNALLGFFYVHTYPFAVSLAADPSTSPPIHRQYGDTDYYFFPTEDLPLFAPLRRLGVPESVIDVVEPFFKVIVDLGYDRSIPPWEPTPARLIPPLNPGKVVADLVTAIGEGINNAFALFGSPVRLRSPVPVTLAAPGTETAKRDISPQVMSTGAAGESTGAQMSRHGAVNDDGDRNRPGDVDEGSVTETAEADEASARPTAASAPEASADASTRRAAKPLGRPATPRPVGAVRSGWAKAARSTAPRQTRQADHSGRRCQQWGGDGRTLLGRIIASRFVAGTNSAGGNSSGGDADDS